MVGDVGAQSLQQSVAQLGPGLLATAEHDRHLDLRPGFQEADDVTLLGLVIVRVDLGTEFLFLDDGLLLVFARLAQLLCRLVLELAVVHDLAHRRFGLWGYFDEVEIGIRCHAEGVFDAHDAHLLPGGSDQSDFRYADALVDAGLSADGASLVRSVDPTAERIRNSSRETTPPASRSVEHVQPNRKALHTAGPKPTDHGMSRLRHAQYGYPGVSETGPLNLRIVIRGRRWEWDSTCCPGVRRDGRPWKSNSHDG